MFSFVMDCSRLMCVAVWPMRGCIIIHRDKDNNEREGEGERERERERKRERERERKHLIVHRVRRHHQPIL